MDKKREFIKITNNFSVDEDAIIDQGNYGKVCIGLKSDERKEVAVKVIQEGMLEQFGKLYQRQLQILENLKASSHPNIVRYYGCEKKYGQVYFFFEKCEGNLMSKLVKGLLKEETVKSYFHDIMAGLVEIHSAGVIHRDLKPQNILFDSKGTLKLTDFGLSRQINKEGSIKLTIKVGNYAYHAPETFQSGTYDERSDVWGAGLILYQMLTGEPLNSNVDVDTRNQNIRKGKLNLSFHGYEPIWQKLLRKMLKYDFNQRPTSKQILDEFNAWNNRSLFNVFEPDKKEEKTMKTIPTPIPQPAKPKQQQIILDQEERLSREVLTSLHQEKDCTQLIEYLQFIDHYYDCQKFSENIQGQILQLLKNKDNKALSSKYPNFFIVCSFFLINTMSYIRYRNVLDKMDFSNHPILEEQCNQLKPFDRQQFYRNRDIKRQKYEDSIKIYEAQFKPTTNKLLTYREKKQFSHFEPIFKSIASLSASLNEATYQNVTEIFNNLLLGIDIHPSSEVLKSLRDAEAKMLFLLRRLSQIFLLFNDNSKIMTAEEKEVLQRDLKSLDIAAIRKKLIQ